MERVLQILTKEGRTLIILWIEKMRLKCSWNFAKFGWFIIPYFPLDLIIGLAAFFIGLYGLFFMPFFTIIHTKKQAIMDLEVADEFLRNFQ